VSNFDLNGTQNHEYPTVMGKASLSTEHSIANNFLSFLSCSQSIQSDALHLRQGATK
jgi:hypothetical protein